MGVTNTVLWAYYQPSVMMEMVWNEHKDYYVAYPWSVYSFPNPSIYLYHLEIQPWV